MPRAAVHLSMQCHQSCFTSAIGIRVQPYMVIESVTLQFGLERLRIVDPPGLCLNFHPLNPTPPQYALGSIPISPQGSDYYLIFQKASTYCESRSQIPDISSPHSNVSEAESLQTIKKLARSQRSRMSTTTTIAEIMLFPSPMTRQKVPRRSLG